jgi:hypothetical protein
MVRFGQTLIEVCPVPSCVVATTTKVILRLSMESFVRGKIATTKKLVVAAERMVNAFRARTGF